MQFVKSTKSSARAKRSRARVKFHSICYTELWTYPYNRIASPLVQLSMGGTSPLTPKMSKRSRESLRWLFVRLGKGSKKIVNFHGHKAKLLFRLWAQGLIKILKLMLGWDLEAEVWSVFCCCCLVEDTKLNLGQDSEARFDQDFKFSRDTDVWL